MPRQSRLALSLIFALTALTACQSAPPAAEEMPPEPAAEPYQYEEASQQLEQVFEDDRAEADYVPLTEARRTEAGISPETIALANEVAQEAPPHRPAERRRSGPRPAPAFTPAPAEETYLLPMARPRAGTPANKGLPLEVGEAVAVDINPYAGGTWITEGANRFWLLRLRSVGASSLSLYFNPLRLPAGSELSLASADGATRHGPYTAADLRGRNEFWTPSVPGDTAVVRLKLPPASQPGLQLNLAQARIGYRAE